MSEMRPNLEEELKHQKARADSFEELVKQAATAMAVMRYGFLGTEFVFVKFGGYTFEVSDKEVVIINK